MSATNKRRSWQFRLWHVFAVMAWLATNIGFLRYFGPRADDPFSFDTPGAALEPIVALLILNFIAFVLILRRLV